MLWPLLFSGATRAGDPNEQFVRIYGLVQEGDSLKEGGDDQKAREKYQAAQSQLEDLRRAYPDWNRGVVSFRLRYVAERLEGKPREAPARDLDSDRAALVGESAALVPLFQEQVRRLSADNELLRAKLKEALTAQPAAVDPRELARAEERIKSLEKDIEVLKVNLARAESRPDKPVDPAVLADARQKLADAKTRLARLEESMAALSLEKETLQRRLQAFADGSESKAWREENALLKREVDASKTAAAATLASRSNELARAQADAADQRDRAQKLAAEKREWESRRDTNLVARARSLEKELRLSRMEAQSARATVSTLETALAAAQREKSALEDRIRDLEARLQSPAPVSKN